MQLDSVRDVLMTQASPRAQGTAAFPASCLFFKPVFLYCLYQKMGGSIAVPAAKTSVSFVLNGHQVVVEGANPLVSLNEWIRAQPGLKGTKRMCGEGGCGCCVVSASFLDRVTQKNKTIAINSVSRSDSALGVGFMLIQNRYSIKDLCE